MQVNLSDVNGVNYSIVTKDPVTLSRWLIETIEIIGPGLVNNYLPARLQIFRTMHDTESEPMFPANPHYPAKMVDGKTLEELAHTLREFFESPNEFSWPG